MTLLKALAGELFVIFGAWLALQQIIMPVMEQCPIFAIPAMIAWLGCLSGSMVYVHLTLAD